MPDIETPYEDLLEYILGNGDEKGDRTGTGTYSVFGTQLHYDISEFFPLLTTKKVWFKGIAEELLWFLRGETNINSLVAKGVHIWDEWADENGDLGPVYGSQWRSWPDGDGGSIDQISNVIAEIKKNPNSRRLIVSAWNPAEVENQALPPCHALFQFYVVDGKLSCQLYQRSADMFLGVPFNIASYALLTYLIAAQTGLKPGKFIWTGGDTHIYTNHYDQVVEQLLREPREYPTLWINPDVKSIFDYTADDIKLWNYNPHPAIKAPVAV